MDFRLVYIFCVFYRTAQLVQASPTVRACVCHLERSSAKQRRPEMVCCTVTGLLKRKIWVGRGICWEGMTKLERFFSQDIPHSVNISFRNLPKAKQKCHRLGCICSHSKLKSCWTYWGILLGPWLTQYNSTFCQVASCYPADDWCQEYGADPNDVWCCWLVALPVWKGKRQSDTRRPAALLQVRLDWYVSRECPSAGPNNLQLVRPELEATFSVIF